MTVVLIKRDCDRHPGCYTMTDKCERCVDEEFNSLTNTFLRRFSEAVARSGDTETGQGEA